MILSNICILILVIIIIFAITILAGWGVKWFLGVVYKSSRGYLKKTINNMELGITIAIYLLLMVAVIPHLVHHLFIAN